MTSPSEPLWDEWDDEEHGSGFCACGVTIPAGTEECDICSAAPHDRECVCDECDDYWTAIQNDVDPVTWRAR